MIYPTQDDLKDAFLEVEEGWYTSQDLLPHFLKWAKRKSRPKITAHKLGIAIYQNVCLDKRKRHGNVAMWHLTQKGLNCRNWFQER